MPRLTDFDPKWIDLGDRKGLGFLFRCVTGHCDGYNAVLFANPIDGGPAFAGDSWALLDELLKVEGLIGYQGDGKGLRHLVRGCGSFRWTRTGEPPATTFEAISLTPSVDCHECGHFTVTNGGW